MHETFLPATAISRLFPKGINRRTFIQGSAALIAGALALENINYAAAQQEAPHSTVTIDDLITRTDVLLGQTNITEAANNATGLHIQSSAYEFPSRSVSIITSNHYDDRIAHPAYFEISSLQSAVPPDFPVIFWGHSGIIKGEKLPFEGLRETVEGSYIFDKNLGEYIAKFVGPAQHEYKIKKALERDRTVQFIVGENQENMKVTGIQIIPHSQMNNETMQALLRKGKAKLATCGTSASFAVRGAEYHCNRLKLHDRSIQKCLKTIQTPDAEGTDIYDAMTTIYQGIKSIDPEFAQFFFAVYARQVETQKGTFRNLSEAELAKQPIPGSTAMGVDFFTLQQIITTLEPV